MMAYANPRNRKSENERGDGFGIVRFDKEHRTVTFEAWPRFANVAEEPKSQYPGWPITVKQRDNDGRKPVGYLKEIVCEEGIRPVVQVIDEVSKEILYTVRADKNTFRPPVYSDGKFTIKLGPNMPDKVTFVAEEMDSTKNRSLKVVFDY